MIKKIKTFFNIKKLFSINREVYWTKSDSERLTAFMNSETGLKTINLLKIRILDHSLSINFNKDRQSERNGMIFILDEILRLKSVEKEIELDESYTLHADSRPYFRN